MVSALAYKAGPHGFKSNWQWWLRVWTAEGWVQGSNPHWPNSLSFIWWIKFTHRPEGLCELDCKVKKKLLVGPSKLDVWNIKNTVGIEIKKIQSTYSCMCRIEKVREFNPTKWFMHKELLRLSIWCSCTFLETKQNIYNNRIFNKTIYVGVTCQYLKTILQLF